MSDRQPVEKTNVANLFFDQRKKLGLSQFKMAVRANTTPGAVALWEVGRTVPRAPIAKLAEAYEVPERRIEQAIIEIRRAIEAAGAKEAAATPA